MDLTAPCPRPRKAAEGKGHSFVGSSSLSSVGSLSPALPHPGPLPEGEGEGRIGVPGSGRPERGQWCGRAASRGGENVAPEALRDEHGQQRHEMNHVAQARPQRGHTRPYQAEGRGKGRKSGSPGLRPGLSSPGPSGRPGPWFVVSGQPNQLPRRRICLHARVETPEPVSIPVRRLPNAAQETKIGPCRTAGPIVRLRATCPF